VAVGPQLRRYIRIALASSLTADRGPGAGRGRDGRDGRAGRDAIPLETNMASARERTQLRGLRHQDYDQDETLLRWSSRTGTYIRDCVLYSSTRAPLIVSRGWSPNRVGNG
jgi:hypothetical protein